MTSNHYSLTKGKYKRRNRLYFYYVLFFVSLFLVSFFYCKYDTEKKLSLKNNWVLSTCYVVDVRYPLKSNNFIKYSYLILNKSHNNHYSFGDMRNKSYYIGLERRTMPIIYDSTNHCNSHMLLFEEDYEQFNLPIYLMDSFNKALKIPQLKK